jgi:hypothetical protein
MTDPPKPDAPLPTASRASRFGYRNIAYLGFVGLLIPLGIALEASGPRGPDRGGGIALALLLWGIVSGLFFVINAVLAIVAMARGRPAGTALIGCALPIAIVLGTLLLEDITVR